MGDALVDQNQLDQIGDYVKSHIGQWLRDQNILSFPERAKTPDNDLLERMITVEQQLKFQNDKLEMMMKQSDRRFNELHTSMAQRFESIDKRFEDMQLNLDTRFQSMDKRFEDMQQNSDRRFESMDKRFESMDRRFGDIQHNMDIRFEDMNKRFNLQTWIIGLGFTMITVLMSLYNFVV